MVLRLLWRDSGCVFPQALHTECVSEHLREKQAVKEQSKRQGGAHVICKYIIHVVDLWACAGFCLMSKNEWSWVTVRMHVWGYVYISMGGLCWYQWGSQVSVPAVGVSSFLSETVILQLF